MPGATPELTPPPIPTDRYQVLERIEHGLALFKARAYDRKMDRQVFIKAEDPENEDAVLRLMREADNYESLDHPRIPNLIYAERSDDFAFLATEFMPGSRSLPSRLREKGPKPLLVGRLCLSTLEILAYVHDQGLLHRDIKTANMLLQTIGVAYMADFGIAKNRLSAKKYGLLIPELQADAQTADTAITKTGDVVGTPGYMAPEQLMGVCESPQGDIYGVGTMMHELLDGRLPFFEAGETKIKTNLLASRKFKPTKNHFWQRGRNIPPTLKRIALKAMEPSIHARYQSAGEMAEDLERCLAGLKRVAPSTHHFPRAIDGSNSTAGTRTFMPQVSQEAGKTVIVAT